MDPKQVLTKKCGQALGWVCQKLTPQALVPVEEARKTSMQTSYRPLKARRGDPGAL